MFLRIGREFDSGAESLSFIVTIEKSSSSIKQDKSGDEDEPMWRPSPLSPVF